MNREELLKECREKKNWRDVYLVAADLESDFEHEFGKIFGHQKVMAGNMELDRPNLDKFICDPYDWSFEFMLRAGTKIPPNFKEEMLSMGITYGWINWASGEESHFSFNLKGEGSISEPKKVQYPKWSEEKSKDDWG